MAADGHVKISLSFDASDAKQGLRSVSKAFDAMAQEVHRAVDDVADETEKLGRGADTSGLERELNDVQTEADKAERKLREVERAKEDALDADGSTGRGLLSILGDFAGGALEGAFSEVGNRVGSLSERIRSKFEPTLELLKHVGETLLDTFVFDLMMSALDGAKEKLGEIINADAQLSGQINTIKGNLSAAFAPLWNAVYPTVVKILNVVTAITSAIANLSAKIFGGAAVATGALEGEAEALGAVGEAAGAASQELGGFDEINTLPSSGGGGGAGGGAAGAEVTAGLLTDLSTTFDDLYERLMSIRWDDVGKRISDALLSIDFKGIGKKITDGVRFVFKAAGIILRNVAWNELGRNIASGLNQMTTLLPDIGQILSDWFSAKIDLLLGFVEEYNWEKLGTSIGQGINNFVNGIEWKKVGLLLGMAFIGLGKTIISAIKTIDTDAIYDAIVEIIRGIDWEGVTLTFTDLLAVAIIKGLELSPAGLALKGLKKLGIIDFDIGDLLEDDLYKKTLSGASAASDKFGAAQTDLVQTTSATDWVLSAFGDTVDKVAGSMGTAADNTSDTAKAASTANSKFKTLFSSVQKGTGNITKNTQAVESGTEALAKNEKASASTILANAALSLSNKNMASTTSDAMITMDDALTANLDGWRLYARELTSLMMSISRTTDEHFGKMSRAATAAVQGVSNTFTALPGKISSAFTGAWRTITDALSGGSSFESITRGVENVFKSSINQLIGGLNDVLDRVERQLNETLVTIKRTQINGTKPFANIQTVNLPSIPRLAKGAVIPANNEFLAVLGDQKRGVNIEAPLDTIVEAMETALQRNGSGSPEAVASAVRAALAGMAVTFDGERVGRVVAAQIDANRRADGKFAYDLA